MSAEQHRQLNAAQAVIQTLDTKTPDQNSATRVALVLIGREDDFSGRLFWSPFSVTFFGHQ